MAVAFLGVFLLIQDRLGTGMRVIMSKATSRVSSLGMSTYQAYWNDSEGLITIPRANLPRHT